jgi:predicted O-linked N-acetylglucosamine transferase (SPINDLY family)/predicted SAM-dependent methyltransferase
MSWLAKFARRAPQASGAPDRETLDRWLREGFDRAAEGDIAEAERTYRKILEHDPGDADALYFLGGMAMAGGREAEAADLYRKAIDARPADPAFWFGLGTACHYLRRMAESVHAYRAGLALQPENATMRNNLAATLLEIGRGDEAREEMETLRRSGFESGQMMSNLGNVYREQARIDEAIAACRRAIELAPNDVHAFTNLLLTLNYSERHDAASLFAEHRRFGARFARPFIAPEPDRSSPRRLRIGYVSPDFRSHVVAFFVEPILANHNRERFEIFCYYSHRWEDQFTERLRRLADHWRDCVHLTDAELAERIRADRIDILVDLAGHTGDHRLRVFTSKPAPLQASYLGYPNTTGLDAIDYRITDECADPPGEAERFSVEQLLRPWPTYFCYRPPPETPDPGPLPALSAGHITFGCFNNLPKVSGAFLEAAARVLAAVPNSRLRLKSKTLDVPHVADRVRARLVHGGVDPARLDIRGWEATTAGHLASYGAIDIALDSFPYNGATTTCEALWMRVPVVTLAADRHAGRMGSSLLNAVGLGEFVAGNVDEYVAKCVALAADLHGLAALRSGLRERMRRSPVMDETGFTRALERGYTEIWERAVRPEAHSATQDAEAIPGALRRAASLRAEGKRLEAEALYKEVLKSRPADLDALTAVWDLSYETGNQGAAVEWLRRGIAANPQLAPLHYMMGYSLLAEGNFADAAGALRASLALEPRMAKAHNNLGFALEAQGALQEAGECYRKAMEADPHLADAVYNLGNLFRQLGDAPQAAQYIGQALALEGGRADWKCNLAELLVEQSRLEDARRSYSEAIAIDPSHARAYAGRGLAALALGAVDEADGDLRKAMELQPDNAELHSGWLLSLHYRGGNDAETLFQKHLAWAKRHTARIGRQTARAEHERRPERRLNIGYVSPDFSQHSLANFIEAVLAAHDRTKVRVFCYSAVPFPDAVTQRLQGLSDEWRDIARMSDELAAERIRADRIDILVDLAGHTRGGRLLLFARKPAPVQVTWLGYPDTTGLAAMDYRLTDAHASPQGADRFHTERLVRMPHSQWCFKPPIAAPEIGESPFKAKGLVTFGSLHNLAKITPQVLAVWARVLNGVPGSRLLIVARGAEERAAYFRESFRNAGIDAGRVECRGHVPLEEFFELHSEVDINLDAFPYTGGTTTFHSLWMGVPVVSLKGETPVARGGASVLRVLGLDELIAASEDDYVRIADALAADGDRLERWRAGLRGLLERSPLMDDEGFTRDLEAKYGEMWERWCAEQERSQRALRLHIGGWQMMPGWKILNIQPGPGVDYVGDCTDLSQFADGSVEEIYASHVLEHLGYGEKLPRALAEFRRVLKDGGMARISVPDFELLCRMFVDPRYSAEQRMHIMRMAFGGQVDADDFHYVGLSFEILSDFLKRAGFSRVERAGEFGLFEDTSMFRFAGVPISLNVIAYK